MPFCILLYICGYPCGVLSSNIDFFFIALYIAFSLFFLNPKFKSSLCLSLVTSKLGKISVIGAEESLQC